MSTSYTERSSSKRIIRSFDVAGMQIIPKVRQAVLVCDGKAGSDPETHPQGGEAGCFPSARAGFGIWVGILHPVRIFSQWRGEGKPSGSLCRR